MKDTDQTPSTGSEPIARAADLPAGARVTSQADGQVASATADTSAKASASTVGATATTGISKPSVPKQAAPAAETPSDPNAGLVVSKTTRAAITQAQQNRAPRSAPAK